jgi:hypothetical protein
MTTSGSTRPSGVAVGLAVLAAVMMIAIGEEWAFQFDITGWGWVDLVLRIVLVLAGIHLMLNGALWARLTRVAVPVISAVVNVAWCLGTRSGASS